MTVIANFDQQKTQGKAKQLETYTGFHKPYNDLFWALAHAGIPFNQERQGVAQGTGGSQDFVVEHPIVLAGGNEKTQYERELRPPPSLSRNFSKLSPTTVH